MACYVHGTEYPALPGRGSRRCVRHLRAHRGRGGDARGKYRTDDLMPDLFAGPYVFLEPRSAFVLDDGDRAVGYVIGAPDTAAFARAYRERWISRLADRYQVPPDPPVTPDDQMLALHYRPERLLWSSCRSTRRICISTCCPASRATGTVAGSSTPSAIRWQAPAPSGCTSAWSARTPGLSASTTGSASPASRSTSLGR